MLAFAIRSHSACTQCSQPLTKFRSPCRHRSLTVRSPIADPGTVESFEDSNQKSFRDLKSQEYNRFSGFRGKQTKM